ncbi:MAG TPA: hypothetical protein VMW95_00725 [Desulfobacterales bacterium]|nr:hypothetical protein [Desulfobacterales bacterium]
MKTTELSKLVLFEEHEVWLPLSRCEFHEQDNEVEVPLWLAEKEGIEVFEV